MARVEIDQIVFGVDGTPVTGASVQVNVRNGGAATVYAAETGTFTLLNPLTTANGQIEGWLEPGSYDLIITDGASGYTARFEAVRASDLVSGTGQGYIYVSATNTLRTSYSFIVDTNLTVSGNTSLNGSATINGTTTMVGALDHNGTTVGFYGVTPKVRAASRTASNWTTGANSRRTIDRDNFTLLHLFDFMATMSDDLALVGLFQ